MPAEQLARRRGVRPMRWLRLPPYRLPQTVYPLVCPVGVVRGIRERMSEPHLIG